MYIVPPAKLQPPVDLPRAAAITHPSRRLPAGLLNETLCRFGVPAFVSFPHMLYADPAVINQTVGQRPNVTQHNFNIDLEPVSPAAGR